MNIVISNCSNYFQLKDLSPQLFQCIDLRYLNVSDNEIRAIPPLISKLANLQVLIFSKNGKFGAIT